MAKIAVMGYYDSIYGFAALGLETYPVDSQEQGKKLLRQLAESDYAVIYMTEALAQQLAGGGQPVSHRHDARHYPDPRRGREHGAGHPERQAVRREGGSAPISCSPINKKGG